VSAPDESSQTGSMLVVHATKKLLERLRPEALAGPETSSTTMLGSWYATVLFWRPQVALFVNEATLLPVLMPLAPAVTLLERFRAALATLLVAHGAAEEVISAELAEMEHHVLAKTTDRSVVGMLNEFAFLADAWRDQDGGTDLLGLSLRLARLPAARSTAVTSARTESSMPGCARRPAARVVEVQRAACVTGTFGARPR
jgi:hypothetical protein